MITDCTRVCSSHFKDADFETTICGIRKLKKGVVPTVFDWNSSGTKPPKSRPSPKQRHQEAERYPDDRSAEENTYSKQSITVVYHGHDYCVPPRPLRERYEAALARIEELEKTFDQYVMLLPYLD
ncbi:hypothetical protein OS493_000900 [Desmophyllum pertusum]|uniref:THAP-type domain-containing protein n=1 Tax=Desmophyllum pertusum TaxID=174260 RepID=A0A9X0D5T2_9CNID|nr:hypothetical protein OS493_000900 [Desmophyllum pertusum]